jgi:hypothetical protein
MALNLFHILFYYPSDCLGHWSEGSSGLLNFNTNCHCEKIRRSKHFGCSWSTTARFEKLATGWRQLWYMAAIFADIDSRSWPLPRVETALVVASTFCRYWLMIPETGHLVETAPVLAAIFAAPCTVQRLLWLHSNPRGEHSNPHGKVIAFIEWEKIILSPEKTPFIFSFRWVWFLSL